MDTIVLVPFRGRETGKSRLSPDLSDECRQQVAQSMYIHVLSTILDACVEPDRIHVVSPSATAAEQARALGIHTIVDRGRDLNTAVQDAVDALGRFGPCRVAVISADLPWMRREDVLALLNHPSTLCRIAPDTTETGTNAILVPINSGYRFQFGPGSFMKHVQQFNLLHMPWELVDRDGLRHDVDRISDLIQAPHRMSRPCPAHQCPV